MIVLQTVIVALMLLANSVVAPNYVSVKNGNIVISTDDGEIVLTHSNRDSEPWTTQDGHDIVFVRDDNRSRTSIYKVNVQSRAEVLVWAGPAIVNGEEIAYFGNPQFDDTRTYLFVVARTGVTSGELLRVDLTTGSVKDLAPAASFDIILKGSAAGKLLVCQRTEDMNHMPFYLYWLYSASGVKLELAGPESLDREAVIQGAGSRVVSASESSTVRNPVDKNPFNLSPQAVLARLINYVPPIKPQGLPDDPRRGRTVQVQVTIGQNGAVESAMLVSGPPVLAQAALFAVRQWKFRPYDVNGKAVRTTTVLAIDFEQ